MKILFMGTPPFAVATLKALCDANLAPSLVVTQTAKTFGRGQRVTPSAVESFAKKISLNVHPMDNVNSIESIAYLKSVNPDLILVAAFGQILKEPLLQMPQLFCLNVHGSLLPKWRGAAPVQRAIWNNDKVTGVTIQKMAKKLDTGDILLQETTEITPEDTSETLMEKIGVLGGTALVKAVQMIEAGKHKFTPQIEAEATYAAKLDKKDAPILWNQPAQQIHCQIRALQPWPVAETTMDGQKLKIFSADVQDSKLAGAPGTVHTDSKSFLHIAAGDGRGVSLTEVQLENRKRLKIREFLSAYKGAFPFKTLL